MKKLFLIALQVVAPGNRNNCMVVGNSLVVKNTL
jgi:hypothetical protein